MSRAQDSRPCTLCLFERAGAYVSCLRFSVYAVSIYFLIILAMHGHTSAKFYIIKSMSTCACRQQKTAQAHPNAYNHADSRAQSAVLVPRICTFLCVAQIIKRKHTAQAHSKRIQSRRLVNENAVSVQIICQFCASCRVVNQKFDPCAQNLGFCVCRERKKKTLSVAQITTRKRRPRE